MNHNSNHHILTNRIYVCHKSPTVWIRLRLVLPYTNQILPTIHQSKPSSFHANQNPYKYHRPTKVISIVTTNHKPRFPRQSYFPPSFPCSPCYPLLSLISFM